MDVLDRYESGVLEIEEVKSVAAVLTAGDAQYQPPAWLQGQLAQARFNARQDKQREARHAEAPAPRPPPLRPTRPP